MKKSKPVSKIAATQTEGKRLVSASGTVTIRKVRPILTCPAGQNLVVVKVETSEPELFGLGCATFTQRCTAVAEVIRTYLEPLLQGRDVSRIRELWRLMHVNGYWRNGPILNNAISGVDQALWDIKGKLAGMPVYDLLGGRVREGAMVYQHAAGCYKSELLDRVEAIYATGVRYVRVQISSDPHDQPDKLAPELAGYGGVAFVGKRPAGALAGAYYDPASYRHEMIEALDHLRTHLAQPVELIHDVHSRLTPDEVCAFAKELEPYRLFFLEDPLPPEHLSALPRIRMVSTTPLALGELFVHPAEWQPLLHDRQIDFLRLHVSAVGGLTPAWQAALLCESAGVRTAWHGPKDVSPVGHAANLHLDLASHAFGIQEFAPFTVHELEIFSGAPELRDGMLYPSGRPGLGVDMDERVAARFPIQVETIHWTQARRPDGSLYYP